MIQNYKSKSWENTVMTQDDKATIATCFNEKGKRITLSELVYAGRWHKFTEPELKQKILEAWQEISLTEIRGCISCWEKRLKLVIEQDGGHIELLL